jgi:hypothetical protein
MAADVAKFAAAIDKVYKTFSTQEVQIDQKEMSRLGERGSMQYVERKFQQQLQRARGAFLHEFRNHSVVVENEVRKIRVELTEKLEEKYGEKISLLREQVAEASVLVGRHREEITHLKSLATAQESYLTAVRHHWGNEQKEKLRVEIQAMKEELGNAKRENADLSSQLLSRDELVAQLQGELSALEGELKRQASGFVEEKRVYDERIRGLRLEMNKQQDGFKEHLKQYEEKFAEYRARTTAELQIQDILNNRRSEALGLMEEERQRHIKARTKPSARIGPAGEVEAEAAAQGAEEAYTMAPGSYRVDDMGMDTSWRDYQLGNLQLVPTARKQPPPKFRVERTCKAASRGPNAPTPTETPRGMQVPPIRPPLNLAR